MENIKSKRKIYTSKRKKLGGGSGVERQSRGKIRCQKRRDGGTYRQAAESNQDRAEREDGAEVSP